MTSPASASPAQVSDVARQLLRGWRRVVGGLLAGLVLGMLVPLLTPTTWTASAHLVVVPVGTGSSADATTFGKVFARVALDPVVLAEAPHLPALGLTPEQAQEVATVSSSPDAPVLEVRGSGSTPFRSAEVANVVGQGIVLYAEQHADDTGFLLRPLVRAVEPVRPSAPRPLLSVLVGLAVGLALGTLAALTARPPAAAAAAVPAAALPPLPSPTAASHDTGRRPEAVPAGG